jgi:hypothetical protein
MNTINRRGFLCRAGTTIASAQLAHAQIAKGASIALVLDGDDPVAASRTGRWAAHELQQALTAAGYAVRRHEYPQQAEKGALCIVASGSTAPVASSALAAAKVTMAATPENLALLQGNLGGRQTILACGSDPRGLSYALLELAERARAAAPLDVSEPIAEQPANPVRSIMRQFVSELYDKPWFYDRAMWPKYFAMLASQRFNRFHLAFGLAYDTLKNVQDSYFLFTYPFLLAVPGYDVRATNVPDAERDKNLDTLRYINEECVAAGLDFELGLWMHGYQWADSPKAQNLITGLTPETHAPYCRDALTALLRALPAVSSVGLRIHGESGVAEGSYDFWKAVFQGAAASGRKVELDLHAKGVDATMIDNALATGLPVAVAPKYSAEHMGMPYHPSEIRPSEIPTAGEIGKGLMSLSEGQRSFTRYGYADLMRDDRKYAVRPRMFAGTQRILMWGDPVWAAAYARSFRFCGMTGADMMEPLTCRGRRGSAVAGIRRSGYLAQRIEPQYDWEKYIGWYRTFGRAMYNPDCDAEVFDRAFGRDPKTKSFETALANASRILPLLTSVHLESAACDLYWPEINWNFPMASEIDKMFWDTPSPKTFQNVMALDPQLFSSCSEFADELLGERSGKYPPVEAALWLEALAAGAEAALTKAKPPRSIPYQRLMVDAQMQARLGQFFAAKLRAGVLFALFEKTGDRSALEQALGQYKAAREQWASLAGPARTVYASDLSVSDRFTERGQWSDRLAGIDADIAAVEAKLTAAAGSDPRAAAAIEQVLAKTPRAPLACTHTPPGKFTPKQDMALEIAVARKIGTARLWYRHVNQAERWVAADMTGENGTWRGTIPGAYTDSPYPLQYYFEFRDPPSGAWIYPGFAADLSNTPYVVLQRA